MASTTGKNRSILAGLVAPVTETPTVERGAPATERLSTRLTGLALDTSYVYRYVAANAAGAVWSDAAAFKTLGPRFAATHVGLNFGANEHARAAAESAGAVVAFTNWNNLSGANGAASAMHEDHGRHLAGHVGWQTEIDK